MKKSLEGTKRPDAEEDVEEVQGYHLNAVSGIMTFSFALFSLPFTISCESTDRHCLIHISKLEISGNKYFVYVQTLAQGIECPFISTIIWTPLTLWEMCQENLKERKTTQTFSHCYCTDENYHHNKVCSGCMSVCKKVELGKRLENKLCL